MGLLVGALTLGTAAPQLLRASAWTEAWREILYAAAALGLAGALAAALWVREGPHQAPAPRFDWRAAGRLMAEPRLLLANLGYLGHMWELYAVWTWMPAMLAESFAAAGWGGRAAAAVAFMAIAAGAPACYLAGLAADRVGRPAVTIAALAASGACTVLAGSLFPHPALLAALCAVWGFAVIADSAQFSACVSELAEPGLTGTALTIQNSLGFLLTLASIRLVAEVQAAAGWRWAFLPLALGPAWGIAAMAGLRRRHARGV
jgi:MFS family permease